MLKAFSLLALYLSIWISHADNVEVESFRRLLAKPNCELFGVGCTKCPGGNTCTQCSNGYTLVFDAVNNYDICVLDGSDPTSAPVDPPVPAPTQPVTPPTRSPSDPPTQPIPPPTGAPSPSPSRSPSDPPTPPGQECKRYRKAWHTLTESERLLYINGWLQIHGSTSIITDMSDMHLANFQGTATHSAHGNSAFLPWHRYYIWELETQFRSLGGDWECFSLPYWDWGHDALGASESIIYSSGLSSEGRRPRNCVRDDFFDNYNIHGGCLERSTTDASGLFSGSSFDNSVELITDIANFNQFLNYRIQLENSHNSPHCAIGGNMCTGISPSDPIFYLHHGYIDFLWAIWQDCHDYDLVSKESLDNNVNPEIYSHGTVNTVELDDLMDFSMIAGETWSVVDTYNPTMRDMHSIADWNVQYDIGSFWAEAGVENQLYCGNAMSSEWFGDSSSRRRRMEDEEDPLDETETAEDYLNSQREIINGRDDLSDEEKREEMYRIGCEYSKSNVLSNGWIAESCEIPDDFEDCADIEQGLSDDEKKYYKIPLQALLNKNGVRDSQCLKDIRTQIYPWLDAVGGLLDLCDGVYDPKC